MLSSYCRGGEGSDGDDETTERLIGLAACSCGGGRDSVVFALGKSEPAGGGGERDFPREIFAVSTRRFTADMIGLTQNTGDQYKERRGGHLV